MSGLSSDLFRARIGDQDATVQSARTQSGIRRVVLLVDLSGSMRGQNGTWGIARAAAGNLLIAGPSTLQVALVLFSDHIIDTIGFDRPASDIVERLAKLERGKGQTATIDALAYASSLLSPSNPGDVVYLITDGGENASKTPRQDVEKSFLSKRIRLFALVVADRYLYTPEEATSVGLLPELARMSGGRSIDLVLKSSFKDTQPEMAADLNHIYDEMSQFYQLQLVIDHPWPKKERLRMDVVDQNGKKRKDLTLAFPEYLLPCQH